MQVYMLLYDEKKSFIMCHKNKVAYFFHDPKGPGGTIYPKGFPIKNGPGDYALPGGRLEDKDVVEGAYKEWLEETNVALNPAFLKFSLDQQKDYVAARGRGTTDFLVGVFNSVTRNLATGAQAAQAVADGKYGAGQYDALREAYPGCPKDNELDQAWLMNVNDEKDWKLISSWKGDKVIGWYYEILLRLKEM